MAFLLPCHTNGLQIYTFICECWLKEWYRHIKKTAMALLNRTKPWP
ncbi:hypothetical protein [Prevotellamassilia timonensis]